MKNLQQRLASAWLAKKSLLNKEGCIGYRLGGVTMPMVLAAGFYALFMLTNAIASMTTVGGVPY